MKQRKFVFKDMVQTITTSGRRKPEEKHILCMRQQKTNAETVSGTGFATKGGYSASMAEES
ncbi:MAG: hypothetical protein A2452_01385 [Candidatus Firestonebacteria bacterium RIFOXYC2_FULL_39_67]|nr:MAG: hypothetical protein A2536_03015 [Candidatus Firestonebacteria bacterium RIFOXYD2_FULL_39_29]OGF53604.1 MAG: hypothetical protein A2452_01385 [Candidatus Firestonebacteria bacterium RIFOXYC2_FULL_39_67]